MSRTAIWKSIADTITAEIAQGHYLSGSKLPTEAALASRFGVNRHTVRHALAALASAGVVHARRGAGVVVAQRPADYALGRRVRFHQNVASMGRTPSRHVSRLETRPSSDKEAEALAIEVGSPVHVIEGVSLADGQPLASFRSVFPAERLPGLLACMAEEPSVTAALLECGVSDYTRASTRVTAKLATAVQALTLQVAEGAPILRAVAINVDAMGVPVEYGTTWFAGDRVSLTVAPD